MTAADLREGDIVKAPRWPGTRGKRYVVKSVSGISVHCQQLEAERDGKRDGKPILGAHRTFHVDAIERAK